MTRKDASKGMPWEPEPDTALRLIWTMAALMFLLAVVSGIGEWRGWWDLAGEIGLTVGGVGSILLTAAGIAYGAGRKQVASVNPGVEAVHVGVQTVREAVLDNGRALDSVDLKLDNLDKLGKLDELDRLGAMDEKLDALDVIQVTLSAQSGALDQQVGLLRDIRDALQDG